MPSTKLGTRMTKNTKVIEKVKKLLSLATSDNENEAKAAAEKAVEILLKHNLSMQQVQDQSNYEKNVLSIKSRKPPEYTFIMAILDIHYFVRIIYSRRNNQTVTFILGEDTNVQVATYVYSFLLRKFRELWSVYKKRTGKGSGSRRAYYWGLYSGIMTQLDSKKISVQKEVGIVLVEDPSLTDFINGHFKTTTTKQAKIKRDLEAQSAGIKDGIKINIQNAVTESNTSEILSIND